VKKPRVAAPQGEKGEAEPCYHGGLAHSAAARSGPRSSRPETQQPRFCGTSPSARVEDSTFASTGRRWRRGHRGSDQRRVAATSRPRRVVELHAVTLGRDPAPCRGSTLDRKNSILPAPAAPGRGAAGGDAVKRRHAMPRRHRRAVSFPDRLCIKGSIKDSDPERLAATIVASRRSKVPRHPSNSTHRRHHDGCASGPPRGGGGGGGGGAGLNIAKVERDAPRVRVPAGNDGQRYAPRRCQNHPDGVQRDSRPGGRPVFISAGVEDRQAASLKGNRRRRVPDTQNALFNERRPRRTEGLHRGRKDLCRPHASRGCWPASTSK